MTDDFGSAADAAIEHAGADAAASLARTKGPPASPNCLNCVTLLSGEFCHHCGQSAQSLRRPFWTLVSESLETFFSLDGRIAHTVPSLLLHPGRMTRNYLDGQRARFIPPFRLYVFASLIFFVLLPLMTGQGLGFGPRSEGSFENVRSQVERAYESGDMSEAEYREALEGLDQLDAMWKGGIPGLVSDPPPKPEPGGDQDAATPESADAEWAGFMPKEALDAVREAGEKGDRDAAQFAEVMDNPRQLARQTQEWIPRLMFVLLPVYAMLLAAVYIWRRQFLFFDHLIVSLHFHSALFFAMSVGFLVSLLIGSGWVILALLVWSNWYLYRLLRTVYGTSKFTAVLRVMTLDSIYFCVLLSGLLTAVVLGALSL